MLYCADLELLIVPPSEPVNGHPMWRHPGAMRAPSSEVYHRNRHNFERLSKRCLTKFSNMTMQHFTRTYTQLWGSIWSWIAIGGSWRGRPTRPTLIWLCIIEVTSSRSSTKWRSLWKSRHPLQTEKGRGWKISWCIEFISCKHVETI